MHSPLDLCFRIHMCVHVRQPCPQVDRVMSNSFGFGGTNACLIFDRYSE